MTQPITTDTSSVEVTGPALPTLTAGWKTTEFWVTIVVSLMSLLAGFNIIGPDWAKMHEQLVNALAFLAATLAPGIYAIARGIAKSGHAQAVAKVASTVPPAFLVTTGKHAAPNDAGAVDLVGLVAGVLVIAGLIWLVVGFTHHTLDVFGLVLLLVGLGVYVVFSGTWRGATFRRRP